MNNNKAILQHAIDKIGRDILLELRGVGERHGIPLHEVMRVADGRRTVRTMDKAIKAEIRAIIEPVRAEAFEAFDEVKAAGFRLKSLFKELDREPPSKSLRRQVLQDVLDRLEAGDAFFTLADIHRQTGVRVEWLSVAISKTGMTFAERKRRVAGSQALDPRRPRRWGRGRDVVQAVVDRLDAGDTNFTLGEVCAETGFSIFYLSREIARTGRSFSERKRKIT